MACHGNCWKDRDTGETFCPWLGKWCESCPMDDYEPDEPDDEGPEHDEDEDE